MISLELMAQDTVVAKLKDNRDHWCLEYMIRRSTYTNPQTHPLVSGSDG